MENPTTDDVPPTEHQPRGPNGDVDEGKSVVIVPVHTSRSVISMIFTYTVVVFGSANMIMR